MKCTLLEHCIIKKLILLPKKRDENIYIQVSDNINDEYTFKRETDPLLQIKDAYPKIVIARTRHDLTQYEGVQIYDIANWLSENKEYK